MSPIAQRAIADSSFIYYDDFSYSSENISELPIGIFDTSIDGLFAVEQFLTLDKFDNITGKPVPDGIPDFGGENFQFLIDKANGPYIDYIEAGNTAFLKEHLMTNVFYCPIWSDVFSVIARAKARSNPVLADFKRSEVYQSKLDENGLLLDSNF